MRLLLRRLQPRPEGHISHLRKEDDPLRYTVRVRRARTRMLHQVGSNPLQS
jgi:hypothetical protein